MLTFIHEEEINPEGIFNFEDCLYDVRSDTIAKHSPEYKTTIQLPYRFQSSVDAPLWNDFIVRVTENDQDKINLLQEFCGYCLMKSCKLEKALFLLGRGSNGKSVFSDTISKVFGRQNVSSVSLENLANPVLRCNLINKYINIDSDLPRNAIDFEEAFRKISSGEPIQFNPKYVPPFTQTPYCKLIYCLNEFPVIDDSSNAFYRRVILIPFDIEFSDTDKDVNLKRNLEDELAGIFRWCVVGYKRILKQGFSKNTFMEKVVHELKVDNNPMLAFAEEELEIGTPGKGITKKGLYKEFKKWTLDHGHKNPSFRKFNNRFYNEYRSITSKSAQMPDGERERYWENVSYKNANGSAYELGERITVMGL
jgi:putative DNA primase/helicase